MKNVKLEVKGKQLVITVDLTEKGEPSKSGNTNIIATTKGNAAVPGHDDMRVGLNLFQYKDTR